MATSISSCDITLKVLIVGDPSVGKSSLVWRLSENIFPNNDQINVTLQNSIRSRAIQFGKKQILVKFVDTVGQERFRTLSKSMYSNTDIIILAYDQTVQASFEHLTLWYKEIERYALGVPAGKSSTSPSTPSSSSTSSSASPSSSSKVFIALASTKSDLTQQQVVSTASAHEFASQKGIPFIETSSLNSAGVEQLLQTVVKGAGERIYQDENWTKLKIKGAETPNTPAGRSQRSPTMAPTSNTSSPSSTTSTTNNTSNTSNTNNTNTTNTTEPKKSSICTIL